jgi:hypothetical protein
MEEEYNSQLGLSMIKFLAGRALEGIEIEEDNVYELIYNNSAVRLYFQVPGSTLQEQVDTVPKIIGARLKDDPEAELSNLEQTALVIDSKMCTSFMRDDLKNERYPEMGRCAERLIQDSAILKAYGQSIDASMIDYQLQMADKIKQMSWICWENPESAGPIMSMEKAHKAGNLEMYEKIKKELSTDLLK